jgi:hypothetical protein
MLWARLLAYVTGTVNQELLLRNEYLAAENRIPRGQIKDRLLLSLFVDSARRGCVPSGVKRTSMIFGWVTSRRRRPNFIPAWTRN